MGLVSKARDKALLLMVLAASAGPFANCSSPEASHAGQAFGKVVRVTATQIQIQSPDAKTPLILVVQSNATLNGVKTGDLVSVVFELTGKNKVLVSLEISGSDSGAPNNAKSGEYGRTANLDTPATPVTVQTPEQVALVEKAIGRERALIKNLEQRPPMVETYIQNTRVDAKLRQVPVDDKYLLSRVDFSRSFTAPAKPTAVPGSADGSLAAITGLTNALGLERLTHSQSGFLDMMFLAPAGFDRQHYTFNYVRKEFLGSVRTAVYDVQPKSLHGGRFAGRIWIEDLDGNIVRFNGAFSRPGSENAAKCYLHFDSWRMNLQPGIWLPVGVYVEESPCAEGEKTLGLKAQTRFWGYSLKHPAQESEMLSVSIDDVADQSEDPQDVSPLEAQRAWMNQAEEQEIDRLVNAGLVAPLTPGGFETTVLDQIVINLEVPNNLNFPVPVRCRILLSDTIEATTVGSTILVSKGLIDALPNEESIASVIAMELAHIALGHRIATRQTFNDRLLFPDDRSIARIDVYHSNDDNTQAAKRAMEFLQASMYKDKLPSAGIFWDQLGKRAKALKALNRPVLGDSLLRPDGTPWLSELAGMAHGFDAENFTQTAALPLGGWIKTDPWNDEVHVAGAAASRAMLSPREKTPLEITPLYFKLDRYALPDKVACDAAAGQVCGSETPGTGTGSEGNSGNPPQP